MRFSTSPILLLAALLVGCAHATVESASEGGLAEPVAEPTSATALPVTEPSPMSKALTESSSPTAAPETKADPASKYRSVAPKTPTLIPLEQAAVVLAHQLQAKEFGDGPFGKWMSGVAHLFTMDCAKAATGAKTQAAAVMALPIAPDVQAFVLGHDLPEPQTVAYTTPGDLDNACRDLATHGFKPECTPDVLDVNGEGRTHLFLHMGDQLNIDGVLVRCALGRGAKTLRGAPLLAALPYRLSESEIKSVQLDGVDGAARRSGNSVLLYTIPGDASAAQTTGQLWVQTTLPVANPWLEFSVTARPRR